MALVSNFYFITLNCIPCGVFVFCIQFIAFLCTVASVRCAVFQTRYKKLLPISLSLLHLHIFLCICTLIIVIRYLLYPLLWLTCCYYKYFIQLCFFFAFSRYSLLKLTKSESKSSLQCLQWNCYCLWFIYYLQRWRREKCLLFTLLSVFFSSNSRH